MSSDRTRTDLRRDSRTRVRRAVCGLGRRRREGRRPCQGAAVARFLALRKPKRLAELTPEVDAELAVAARKVSLDGLLGDEVGLGRIATAQPRP